MKNRAHAYFYYDAKKTRIARRKIAWLSGLSGRVCSFGDAPDLCRILGKHVERQKRDPLARQIVG